MKEFEELKPFLLKKRELRHLSSIIYYDMQTRAPIDGLEDEADIWGGIDTQYNEIIKSPEYIKAVKDFAFAPGKDLQLQRLADLLLREVEDNERLTLKQLEEWNKAISESNSAWRQAKKTNDFQSWLPHFEKLVELKKGLLRIKKKDCHETLYDVALDEYEPGETQKQLDAVFEPLKKTLLELLPQVMKRQENADIPAVLPHSIDSQRHLTPKLLELIHYDLNRGAIAESAHPFSDALGINDARITTEYDLEDYHGNLSTVLHEGGHCIQFQNWPKSHYDHFLENYATAALCETHSRFYENLLGKSRELAPRLLSLCRETFGEEFLTMTEEQFYRGENVVKPSLIRCDADELTYSLHIIIRYELERDLLNGDLEPKDLPKKWNEKYKEYLGVDVPSDSLGCMQDTHWSEALFGYFPSYALGNLYGAQIMKAMEKDLDIKGLLAKGDLLPIRKWFAENDFAYDYLKPEDWIIKVTGEKLNPQYFIDYLKDKFLA